MTLYAVLLPCPVTTGKGLGLGVLSSSGVMLFHRDCVVKSLCIDLGVFCDFAFLHLRRITSSNPPQPKLQFSRGGISRVIRCKCANSAAFTKPRADTKCQFSGLLPCSRQSFRRIKCEICTTFADFAYHSSLLCLGYLLLLKAGSWRLGTIIL